jgi:hypothetical protein
VRTALIIVEPPGFKAVLGLASKVNCCMFKHVSHSRPVADFFLQLAAEALPGKLAVLRVTARRFTIG